MLNKSVVTSSMEYYDISPVISEKLAVFPGDTAFKRRVVMDFGHGHHIGLSSIETTVHLGAHVDAPSHYHAQGQTIDSRGLHYYLGNAQVISVQLPRGERIRAEHFTGVAISAKRVLFKTRSFPDPNHWNDDFNSFSPELIHDLAKKGVILVGIDTPSCDPATSKLLEAHQAIFKNNMANLEGLILDEVPDGMYHLVALPLRIEGGDASPVRAVLWKKGGSDPWNS